MKRNFYLQHPLMAMHDPRMQYLLKMEKLKGTGAYWFVIEKLAMLPGSCVDMEFLRPYCKMHKISLLMSRRSFSVTSFSILKRTDLLRLPN